MASNPYTTGSGGGGSGGGNPYGGGGGSSSGGKRKPRKTVGPKVENIRIAARLLKIKNAHARSQAEDKVGEVFSGLDGRQITKIGRRAGLSPGDVQRVVQATENVEVRQGPPDWGAVAWPIDLLDRVTARPVKRAIVKSEGFRRPWRIPEGLYEGSVEGKSNPGTQAVIALAGGGTEKESAKTYQGLPGYVKVPGDIAADTALDWTTYATFGTSAVAEAAARTAAKKVAGDAAEHAVLSPKALEVYQRILQHGKKALTPSELDSLPAAVRRRLNRNKGGFRFAGLQASPVGLGRNMGPKKEGGILAALEQKLRPRGALRQAERRGELPVGVTRSVENVQSQVRGGKFLASLKPREYEKAAEAISKHFGEDDLDVVREALDVAGGPQAVDAIPDGPVKDLAVKLREMSAEDFQKAVDLGRLQTDDVLDAADRQLEMFGDDIDFEPHTPQERYYPRVSVEGRPPPRRGTGDTTGRAPGYVETRVSRDPASTYLDDEGLPIFEQDPVVAFGRHGKDVALDETYVKAWQELQRMGDPNTGMGPVIALPKDASASVTKANNPDLYADYDVISRPVTRDTPEGLKTVNEEILVHKTIKQDFEKVMDLTERGAASQKILDTVDNLNAVWASWATATPGFIARNVVQGNFFMGGVLAGAANPRIWAQQLGVMRRMAKGVREAGNPYVFLTPAEKQVVEQAIRTNSVESNFMQNIVDLGEEATRRAQAGRWVRRGKASPVSVNFAPIKMIRDVNKWFEQWSRLSVFANKMKQGYAPPEAGFITRKYMIDYTDLAPANQAARHVSPFLTWTYKSVPMILGTLAKDPRKITIPMHILNAVNAEGMRSEGLGYLPEYQKEGGGVVLPRGIREMLPGSFGDNPQTIIGADPIHSTLNVLQPAKYYAQAAENLLRGNHPEALGEAWRTTINSLGLGGSLGGLIQWGLETQAGREFFSGQKFEPGQQVPTPKFLRMLTGNKLPETMDWSTYNALAQTFPAIQRMESITPSTDYAKTAQARRALSQTTGIQAYPVTKASQRSEMYRRREILMAFKRALEGRGVKIPDSDLASTGGDGNPYG